MSAMRAHPSRLSYIPAAYILLLHDWPALGQLKPDCLRVGQSQAHLLNFWDLYQQLEL